MYPEGCISRPTVPLDIGSTIRVTVRYVLHVRQVHKSFGAVRAVRGVSFEIRTGSITGLLGPNGAGKSTTIRMIAGLIPPDAGSISVGGFDTIEESIRARGMIGYMPENSPLYDEMTPLTLLDFHARLRGIPRRERRKAVGSVLERCRLSQVQERRIRALSKGFRQRVSLASAILGGPSLLMLDEPTSGLDPGQVVETRALVRELGLNAAVLITSHVLAEIEAMCTDAVIIAGGRVLAQGPLEELAGATARRCVMEVHAGPGALSPSLEELSRRVKGSISTESLADAWTRVTMALPEDASPTRIAEIAGNLAFERGLKIRRLEVERGSLESLFLDVTGRRAEDAER